MPEVHAKVTASGSHRWLNCTASVERESHFPDSSSPAAAEGTEAHALAEKKLLGWLKSGRRQRYKCEDEVMQEATDGYRDYVIELMNSLKESSPELNVEVQLDLSEWIPEGFGTSDACIVSTDCLHIVDLKYGKGVKVDAPENPQMRLYALGAVARYWPVYEFDKVMTHIYQPRLDHISTEELTVKDLLAWGETVKPKAREAFDGTGSAHSGEWCTFCRCRDVCRTRAQEMFEVLEKQQDPKFLSVEEVAAYLPKLDDAIKWAKGLQEHALSEARSGTKFPGYKLVEGRSVRKVREPNLLADALREAGYGPDLVWKPQELQTITNLEKLVGKKTFASDYGKYLEKPKGKPVLVPESDKRPEWQDATPEEMFGKGE
ncbi:DUF2800 domain-containing protein [uncultured Faecalibaculum sp.]|uniref:DUF2800 domain-containing protein n=1 Tax=uncultured Faecalibaculum sp. TaxID=1729681 RepID=UPI0025ECCA49|nr:DUF2800 domain-containing protein [uncultured Faecalibaculum sp.]